MKIGDIHIAPVEIGDATHYTFTRQVLRTYSGLGTYSSIEEGVELILEKAVGLRPNDRNDLEKLKALIKEKDGDLKEVRKALIELE